MRSSASRPVSGASSPSTRWTPPTADSTRVARHNRCGSALPFRTCSPASANPTPRPASRDVAPSVSTCPGSAAAWTRAAVFTASPATIPSWAAPRLTATSPVTTLAPHGQARHADLSPERLHRRHQVQGAADCALRVAFGGRGRAPDRHHRVADELLDHSPVTADDRSRHPEVPRQQFPHRLRVTRFRQRGEPNHVAEQHRAHPPLRHRVLVRPGSGRGGRGGRYRGAVPASGEPQARQSAYQE